MSELGGERVGLTLCRSLPVYLEQRTSTDRPRWSGPCHSLPKWFVFAESASTR
jgi:hypothetical protein